MDTLQFILPKFPLHFCRERSVIVLSSDEEEDLSVYIYSPAPIDKSVTMCSPEEIQLDLDKDEVSSPDVTNFMFMHYFLINLIKI